LERAGFVQVRHTGSHVILHREGHPKALSVPYHKRDMRRGTVLGILGDAGLTQDELIALL
jgi:predicted RNA binding protein YcfA (HicA-like mRNA interferase family)